MFHSGLIDRTNEVCTRAKQVRAGSTDTNCEFNMGGDDYVEFVIETSPKNFQLALSASGCKKEEEFGRALVEFYTASMRKTYGNAFDKVIFLHRTTSKSGNRYYFTCRVQFTHEFTDVEERTEVIEIIEKFYNELLTKWFVLVAKTLRASKETKIERPKPITKISKRAILTRSEHSKQSITSGSQITLTKVEVTSKIQRTIQILFHYSSLL